MFPSSYDRYLFCEGTHYGTYRIMGSHLSVQEGLQGAGFSLWAPNAGEVRVVGDFNGWDGRGYEMQQESGIWTTFIPGLEEGELYKYEIHTLQGEVLLKADPYGFYSEMRPGTASRIFSWAHFQWHDEEWQEQKKTCSPYDSPMLIYEVHLGSWKRKTNGEFVNYRELADELVGYLLALGYTHVEILPVTEHPLDGSWGYQNTGYYSVTSRHGNPHDFIDKCHQKGIGVILDWVPGHFCKNSHGLWRFDGTHLFEYQDPRRGENLQWGTANFDLGKPEVRGFLISNAFFWLDVYHIDGLRVDAVSSMLYLDYGKKAGEWFPNEYGGKENLEAVDFLQKLNEAVDKYFPGTLMIAEESSAWPRVTQPASGGGLGFNYKWNMGWMNDTLRYLETDPVNRKDIHNLLTFSFMYTYSENFILTLSHDEVVHCKKSLLSKMPGDYWQKFANLRLLYGYMLAHPGKKLLFMGGEWGQFAEWNENRELDWHLLEYELHKRLRDYVGELNHFYRKEKILWELDHFKEGFQWIDPHNYSQSVITFMRIGKRRDVYLLVVCNFTPAVLEPYRIGVPEATNYLEVFNSDLERYGGAGHRNTGKIAEQIPWHNQPYSLEIKVPPLAMIIFQPENRVKGATRCLKKSV